jgi:lysophospholipase L1-like esterase
MIKGLGLSALSVVFSLSVIVGGSKLYASWLGIRDTAFRYENQLDMWDPEPTIGFVNKANFSDTSFGHVPVQTNDRGFRGTRKYSDARANGIKRIVGLGDSVMWGTGVAEEKSIPGFLEKLNRESSYRVINAAVVGYSTYQELLYLQEYILPLNPDIVLVNFCENDLLPTEDPFRNIRGIYIQYLKNLLESRDETLTPEEKSEIKQLIRVFESADRVWDAMNQIRAKSLDQFTLAWKVFVLIPMARMAELSREAGVRLIYVFIPPQRNQSLYSRNVELLKKLLTDKGAEFVDVQSALIPKQSELMKTGHSQLAWVWPRELKSILQFRSMRTVQRRDKFIDWVHPTVKGNAIIAEHVYRYLTEGPEAKETGLPDKR